MTPEEIADARRDALAFIAAVYYADKLAYDVLLTHGTDIHSLLIRVAQVAAAAMVSPAADGVSQYVDAALSKAGRA